MPMPPNKRADGARGAAQAGAAQPRLRHSLRLARTVEDRLDRDAIDPEDFIRIEVDKASVPADCTLGKHPTHKTEFVRGYPVFADVVTCQLP